jgi:hypothetical protein
MTGNYYMLPPYANNIPNTQWGTITWQKVESQDGWWKRHAARLKG